MIRPLHIKYFALLLIFSVAAYSTISCRVKKGAAAEQTELKNATAGCTPMQLEEEPLLPVASDLFDLDSVWIEGYCLNFLVGYSGGCGSVDFQLYYNDKVMKSMPPQTSLFLAFTDSDPCRSLIQDTLRFDLSPFEAMARAGGVILNVAGYDHKVTFALPLH
jgi:hypothetical protein